MTASMANHRRIEIIRLLRKQPLQCVDEIAEACKIDKSTVSEHLRRLAGRRDGRQEIQRASRPPDSDQACHIHAAHDRFAVERRRGCVVGQFANYPTVARGEEYEG
jgi:predicted transcriptional regulator